MKTNSDLERDFLNKYIAMILIFVVLFSHAYILLSNSLIIAKEISDIDNIKINIQQELKKHVAITYEDDTSGIVFVQTKINMTINDFENYKEDIVVKNTKISIPIPKYLETNFTSICVSTVDTGLANGDIYGEKFTKNNWNIENNQIIITINNDSLEKMQEYNEFYITYYYGEDAYEKYSDKIRSGEYIDYTQSVNVEMTVLNEEKEHSLNSNFVSTMNTKDIQTEQVTSEINTDNINISKGKMYANFNNDTPIYETDYNYDTLLNINYINNIQKIELQDSYESFIKDEEFYVIQENETRYKSTKINKVNFINIFGEDGYLKIYNSNGELLYTIDKNYAEENGFYVINYDSDYSNLKFEFSKPINEGIIELNNQKEFTGHISLYKQDIQRYNVFQIKTDTKSYINTLDEIHQNSNILNFNLIETTSKATMSLSNNKLSTILENNNLDIKIELNNSNFNSDLWVEPSFIIEFPEEVEDIEVRSSDILYDGGLGILSIQKINFNNKSGLRINMSGMQKEFVSEAITKGTTIILNMDIKLKDLVIAKKDNIINLYYQNMNSMQYENKTSIVIDNLEYETGLYTSTIDYISPMEMQLVQKISNYNEDNSIISIGSGEKLGNLEILADSKIANVDLVILNNTGNECEDVRAIGRIPFKDNKDVITNELLGTTIDTTLENIITINNTNNSNIKIFYSENPEATADLNLQQNGWTTEFIEKEKIKSFLIYIDNMQNGEMLNFNYSFKIPEQLEHGEYFYPSFGVYFNNITQEGKVEENVNTEKIGLTTGIGARLKLNLSANFENNAEVNEGEKIQYHIHVENTGSVVANDVVITNPIPKGTTFVQEETIKNPIETINQNVYYSDANELKWNVGNIDIGKSIDLEYEVLVDKLPTILEYYGMEEGFTRENGKYYIINNNGEQVYKEEIKGIPDIYIENKFYVESSDISKSIESNIWKNKVNLTYVNIKEESSIDKTVYISENQEFEYIILLKNNTDIELNNILVEKDIPEGIIYKECEIIGKEIEAQYDEENRKLNINLDRLMGEETAQIKVKVQADKLGPDEYKKEIKTKTNAILEGSKTSSSNEVINYIGKPNIEYSFNSNVLDRYVYEGDILNYKINISNKSDILANNFMVIFKLPENSSFVNGKYIEDNQEYTIGYDESGEIKVETNLKGELILDINIKIEKLGGNLKEKEVLSEAIIRANNFEEISIGKIKHTILKKNNSEGGDTAPDGTTVYKIKGTAWLDENKDGQRQEGEKLLPNMKAVLLDEKGQTVKDRNTNQDKIVMTDKKGEYSFENLLPGKYFVIFAYDSENYDLTYYQKENVGNDQNSDVILTNINLNGQMTEAAITNILDLEKRSLYSIDIGLVNKTYFDLSIENTIEKINLNSYSSISTKEYNSNFAKLDIRAKNINNSNVLIEFKIKIKNTGDIDGIASKIVFEKSNGLTFNSELNSDWYVGNDGKLYTTQLKDIYIKPGEEKEIKLILTKEMNDSNTGTFENNAKILEMYNDKSLEDSNIENNESNATCLITVATGTIVIYTVAILVVLVILACGIIGIRKIVIR